MGEGRQREGLAGGRGSSDRRRWRPERRCPSRGIAASRPRAGTRDASLPHDAENVTLIIILSLSIIIINKDILKENPLID